MGNFTKKINSCIVELNYKLYWSAKIVEIYFYFQRNLHLISKRDPNKKYQHNSIVRPAEYILMRVGKERKKRS